MTKTPFAVVADDLSLKWESRRAESEHVAVDGATFQIPVGEILAVIGETGSGKSSLAQAVAGLAGTAHGPSIVGGSLTVLGRSMRSLGSRKRERLGLHIGYVPQDAGAALDPRLMIGENIAAPIFARDPDFDQRDAAIAVATLVDAVHLPLTTMNRFPHELSRGQRQRVAIARALILEPTLLVADDPTSGVDVNGRAVILDIVRELHEQREFSALIVSHTISEVRRVSSRVAVMHRGIIVALGPVDEVLDSPSHSYVEGLARVIRDLKTAEELSAI
ncbi:ATP-binding cassette domain-containing protein [Galbitalea soli]|uniref:ABC transporter ATP-binding protein n=1 Tax=Galbitalea soli TaxID=1268042 RepID=A0A7C9PLV2_9MICO|nr:ABC transporter ATP-binding protein [Galbitalea soli]NYJ31056.1 ABC-type glutathione transport system ATPase component [Galbitalea soli]